MTIGIALNNLRKVYQAKKNFIIHCLIVQLVIKNMDIFITFGKFLKWAHNLLSKLVLKC